MEISEQQRKLLDAQAAANEARVVGSRRPIVPASMADRTEEQKAFDASVDAAGNLIYRNRKRQSTVAAAFSKTKNPEDVVAGEARSDWDPRKG